MRACCTAGDWLSAAGDGWNCAHAREYSPLDARYVAWRSEVAAERTGGGEGGWGSGGEGESAGLSAPLAAAGEGVGLDEMEVRKELQSAAKEPLLREVTRAAARAHRVDVE